MRPSDIHQAVYDNSLGPVVLIIHGAAGKHLVRHNLNHFMHGYQGALLRYVNNNQGVSCKVEPD